MTRRASYDGWALRRYWRDQAKRQWLGELVAPEETWIESAWLPVRICDRLDAQGRYQ